jgi:predicted nicotinamide N-methyase
MTDPSITNECSDPTQTITIEIPCALAERIDRNAKDNGTTVTGVMIEALDTFLRNTD